MKYTKEEREEILKNAYLNACDCLYHGYGKDVWNSYDLTKEEKDKVWKKAFKTISEGRRY